MITLFQFYTYGCQEGTYWGSILAVNMYVQCVSLWRLHHLITVSFTGSNYKSQQTDKASKHNEKNLVAFLRLDSNKNVFSGCANFQPIRDVHQKTANHPGNKKTVAGVVICVHKIFISFSIFAKLNEVTGTVLSACTRIYIRITLCV